MIKTQIPEAVKTPGPVYTKVVRFDGKNITLNLHMITFTYPDFSFDIIDKVTNEAGHEVEGLWFWGTYGNIHRERLEFDERPGKTFLTLRTVSSWCNGRVKNGRKTLRSIVEKQIP